MYDPKYFINFVAAITGALHPYIYACQIKNRFNFGDNETEARYHVAVLSPKNLSPYERVSPYCNEMIFYWWNTIVTTISNSTLSIKLGSSNSSNWNLFAIANLTDLSLHQLLEQLTLHTFYSRFVSSSAEALEHIVYACLVYFLVCLGIYKLTFLTSTSRFWRLLKFVNNIRLPETKVWRRVLFVTSHPDDECMFFGPLIYSLAKRNGCQVYVLCLSNGNYDKQSDLRREELWRSCTLLGIPSSNIILVNATNLPDDPNVEWKTEAVANLILNTVESLDIQAILTFDRDGVSQHPNHCAVYYATASLCLANLLPKDCKFYTLDSINIVRKYLSIFDLLCTCFMSTHWCILSWNEATIIRRAMMEHKSQMKWFRWLYIYFSRYMFINSLREVNLSDVELEMQIHEN